MLTVDQKIRLFNGVGSWETYTADGKIPRFFMSDGPHGLRKQDAENYRDLNASKVATCFPTASCIASSWDVNSASELGKAIAMEAKAENINLMLGPGMNIKRSPLCGRNFEYFSEDPVLTAKMAAAYVNGMQNEGIGACIKHFACNNQEKRRQTSSSNLSEKTLRKIYLSAFEYVVKNAKPAAVMCSYNKVNGTYTCHNRHLLTEILRDEWKYEGVVVSDWGACIDAAKCLKAGMDLAMPDSYGYFDRQLKTALEQGNISEKDLDTANTRLLNLIQKYQLKENPPVDYEKQHQIALKLALNSAVLLENDGILPLKPSQKLIVMGDLAKNMKFQGGGSSHITTASYPNALEALQSSGFQVEYCQTVENLSAGIKASPATPVLLFVGLTDAYEGEGFDRTSLKLPEYQLEMIQKALEITSNVVIISFSGAPIDLTSCKTARGILHMYLCGQACGEAVARLVTGQSNPSGKLAESWPFKVEDTPSFGNFALETDNVNYEEGELIGYRWYNAKNIPVQYPFGYGLSYTTFQVKLAVDEDKCTCDGNKIYFQDDKSEIKVNVSNTGNYPGAEVVQCYKNGELCGFEKVYLEPGETKNLTIDIINILNMYNNLDNNIPKIPDFPIESRIFTSSDSLGDMAKVSFRIKCLLNIIKLALKIMNHKSWDDPSLKIEIAAICENPLESLISTSGGIISEKLVKTLVKWAN